MNARTKIIGTVAVAAAMLAPVAQAQRPDDRAGLRGPGALESTQSSASSHPDNRALRGPGAIEMSTESTAVRPDDRAEARGPGAIESTQQAPVRPDDRAGTRGPGAFEPVLVSGSSSTGFDWGDAFIGALGGLGMALALTGILLLGIGRRSGTRTA